MVSLLFIRPQLAAANVSKFMTVAALIWKTQDRMCQQGHPNAVEGGLHKLYSEVIQSDREMRELMDKIPVFFKNESGGRELPAHVRRQREVLSISFAHKV
jgi:hypothetical protein